MAKTIHLVRHAIYEEFNPHAPRFIGHSDPHLSKDGQNQARSLSARFEEISHLPIYSSTSRRAQQTAQLAFPSAKIEVLPEAKEIYFGELEGLNIAEATMLFPEFVTNTDLFQNRNYRPAGGENLNDVTQRAVNVMETLEAKDSFVLVSHAIFISVLAHHLCGYSDALKQTLPFCGHLKLSLKVPEDPYFQVSSNQYE